MPWVNGEWQVSDVFGAAAYHLNVKIACPKCGHFVCYNGHCFWWLLYRQGRHLGFWDLRSRYYCGPCFRTHGRKVRPKVEGVKDPITNDLPAPSERDWKRAQRRVR